MFWAVRWSARRFSDSPGVCGGSQYALTVVHAHDDLARCIVAVLSGRSSARSRHRVRVCPLAALLNPLHRQAHALPCAIRTSIGQRRRCGGGRCGVWVRPLAAIVYYILCVLARPIAAQRGAQSWRRRGTGVRCGRLRRREHRQRAGAEQQGCPGLPRWRALLQGYSGLNPDTMLKSCLASPSRTLLRTKLVDGDTLLQTANSGNPMPQCLHMTTRKMSRESAFPDLLRETGGK